MALTAEMNEEASKVEESNKLYEGSKRLYSGKGRWDKHARTNRKTPKLPAHKQKLIDNRLVEQRRNGVRRAAPGCLY